MKVEWGGLSLPASKVWYHQFSLKEGDSEKLQREQEFYGEIWKSYINKYEEEKMWKIEKSHLEVLATIMDVKLFSEIYSGSEKCWGRN